MSPLYGVLPGSLQGVACSLRTKRRARPDAAKPLQTAVNLSSTAVVEVEAAAGRWVSLLGPVRYGALLVAGGTAVLRVFWGAALARARNAREGNAPAAG